MVQSQAKNSLSILKLPCYVKSAVWGRIGASFLQELEKSHNPEESISGKRRHLYIGLVVPFS